jgi:hypothetical protein
MARRRSLQLATVCFFLLASTGCMTAGVNSPAERAGPLRSDEGAIWFWGITDAVKYAEECKGGLAEVRTQIPWYGYFVSLITLGIVNPIARQYYCASV